MKLETRGELRFNSIKELLFGEVFLKRVNGGCIFLILRMNVRQNPADINLHWN
jgi:hypothetical protein